jgi:hypothetical protein
MYHRFETSYSSTSVPAMTPTKNPFKNKFPGTGIIFSAERMNSILCPGIIYL